jgi:hypothetical protein
LPDELRRRFNHRYRAPAPIVPASNRPLYVAGLRPRDGASIIPLDESSGRLIGAEHRVGRGRVLMLSINPTDEALASWPGLDSLIRRVILRRPEETVIRPYSESYEGSSPPAFRILSGPELSWFRLLSRDFKDETTPAREAERLRRGTTRTGSVPGSPYGSNSLMPSRSTRGFSLAQVAAWDDSTALPRLCRDELERASGITIPSSSFVLTFILAYLVALVPLNWLICRYVFGRREWAWISVPILALGFAIGVERVAAYDLGYDRACDEIDVVEVFGDYPRAHVSRFASLYSTGRVRFSIAFPGNPSALALPLDSGRSLRGEDITTSIWNSYPVPALDSFLVQPRSLAMFRSEQMTTLAGPFSMVREGGSIRVVNESELELRDAVLIDVNGPGRLKETFLGTIAPGVTVAPALGARQEGAAADEGLDPEPFLRAFRTYVEDRPENQGELRLVGWSPRPQPGVKLEPAVDRHRGFSLVVVHLRHGPPPAPDGPAYFDLKFGSHDRRPGVGGVARRSQPPTSAREEAGGS